ncbi:MAG: hypothetical protein RIT04_413 [Candidatus Parcubacteria bacterium]|jgi:hypothetical protein
MQPNTTDITAVQAELAAQRLLLERVFISVEKTRKYFLWTMIATIIAFVLPFVGLMFVIPSFLASYEGALQGLGM